jgi:hypothetical protein
MVAPPRHGIKPEPVDGPKRPETVDPEVPTNGAVTVPVSAR